jgi:hypothetical protein
MQPLKDIGDSGVNFFVDWLYGKENNGDAAIAATAKHVQAHVTRRPAAGRNARWPNIAAMKYAVSLSGPNVTPAQFDSALSSCEASIS